MRSKYLSIFVFCGLIGLLNFATANAQITSDTQNGYIMVHSYNGSTTENAFGYHIRIYDKNVNIQNWSLMVRVNGLIRNGEGKIVDPTKLRIRINTISGDGPTLAQIGTNNIPVPLSQTDVAIFRNSKAPITSGPNNSYKTFSFSFDIITEGGAYLEPLKSWQEYNLNVVFSLRSSLNQLITGSPASARMQIYPQGVPPAGPTYSILVNGDANDASLDFNSVAHYANGVSKTYNSGLSVNSSTNYSIQIKTLTSDFQATSTSVPVSTVQLNLKQVGTIKEQTVTLSPNLQTVLANLAPTGSQPHQFDIRYFTQPNDARLLNAKPDTYKTTIMYTLIPQ